MPRRRRQRRTVYVGDQRWKIERSEALRGCDGDCNYDLKRIRIHARLVAVDLLDTLIHELIHARWPDLSEDAVADFAETLSGVLDAEGFRQPDHEED
jgi:hypothetical protein